MANLKRPNALVNQQEILSFYGIELSVEDLFKIRIIEWQNSQKQRFLCAQLNCYQVPVHNGKTLLVIGAAALGFGIALLLGAGLATAIAIGAAAGYRMLRGNQQRSRSQSTQQTKVSNAPGFDSVPQPPQIGGVIPLIYCNSAINPSGGVRVGSATVFSRILTNSNKQNLLLLRVLGIGEIVEIDPTKLLIDNQNINNFYEDELITKYSTGEQNQPRFEDVNCYSQAVSPSTANTCGYSLRGTAISNSGNTVTVSADDFDNFTPTEVYASENQFFRVINKSASNNQLFLNKTVTGLTNKGVLAFFEARFTTQKRCTQIDVNIVASVWARNSNSELVKFGTAFFVILNDVIIRVLYIVNSKEGEIRRAFTLKNLPLQQHKIRLQPVFAPTAQFAYSRLDDSGVFTSINTGIFQGGKEVILDIESKAENAIALNDLSAIFSYNGKPQRSSDRGASLRVTSYNQIVYPQDIGGVITNYPYLKLAFNNITASDRLQGSPSTSDFVEKGLPYRNHMAAGSASPGSASNQLIANGSDISSAQIGYIVRNVTRRIESLIDTINGTQIISRESLNWREGDTFLVYFTGAITYFPDVYVHTLLDKYTLGYTNSEGYINYPSIVRSRKFCVANNFFFNDVVETQTNWEEWATRESLASLLTPTDFAGVYGLIPEQETDPVAVFTTSNILPGTYRESPPEQKTINAVQLTYNGREDDNLYKKTITVLTEDAYLGIDTLAIETLEYESVSTLAQAKSVAARYLKSRLLQNRVIQFKTGLQGFSLDGGDLILVQHTRTEADTEFSGFCLSANNLVAGSQQIELSRKSAIAPGATATIYHTQTGLVEKQRAIVQSGNNFLISGLQQAIQAKSALYNGDIVIINKQISNKLFKVANITPENYAVNIYAINWSPDLLSDSGLYFVV